MTKIGEKNFSCDVGISEYGKDKKDVIIRYFRVDIKINDDYLILYNSDFETEKLKLNNKYSVEIYRYSEEPMGDVYYYVDGYLIKNTDRRIKLCYDKFEKYEYFGNFNLTVIKPKEYLVCKELIDP